MASKENAPRRSGHTKQFAKDWKRLARSGRYPMQELQDVMQLLVETAQGEEAIFVRTGTHAEIFE